VHDIIDRPNDTFGLAVLLGCVRARKAKMNTLLKKKKGAGCIVVEFTTIVALKKLYTAIEMSEHIAMKIAQSIECFKFQFKRKNPQIMSEIIQTHKIVFGTGYAHNRRRPQIIVD
jgi:hypothetical protein